MFGKKNPAIFVFNLKENVLERLEGIPNGIYPERPIFDECGKGLLFAGVLMPNKKLGLNANFNRCSNLYYIPSPVYDKKD